MLVPKVGGSALLNNFTFTNHDGWLILVTFNVGICVIFPISFLEQQLCFLLAPTYDLTFHLVNTFFPFVPIVTFDMKRKLNGFVTEDLNGSASFSLL